MRSWNNKNYSKNHKQKLSTWKNGVELTLMEGKSNQEVDIIGDNISLLLYTRFVISVGKGF